MAPTPKLDYASSSRRPSLPCVIFAKLRQLGPFGVLAAVSSTLPPVGSILLLTYIDAVSQWFRSHQALGPAIYVIAFGITGGLALMPTYAASALGGWAFGFALGFPTVMAGIMLATTIAYTLGRLAARDRFVQMLNENPKSRVIYAALLRGSPAKTTWIVTLMRLPPNAPFAISNFLLAGAKVGPLPYAIGTLVGMAPRTAAVCWFASHMSSDEFRLMDNPWSFAIGIVMTLAVLIVLGSIARRALDRATADQPVDPTITPAGGPGEG